MAMPRESAFLPTIKCSSCGGDVQISMMGEHICASGGNAERTDELDLTTYRAFADLNFSLTAARTIWAIRRAVDPR